MNNTKDNIKDLVKDILHKELEAILPEIIQMTLEQVEMGKIRMIKSVINPHDSLDEEDEENDNKEDVLPITHDDNNVSEMVTKELSEDKTFTQ
eukprot:10343680-Ditylum_brightwellii.AAC.1